MTESLERARVSRRSFLGGVGVTAGGLMVASGPVLWQQAAKADTVTAEQVHLTFGADPAREVVVSWVTPVPVSNPTVVIGRPARGFGRTVMSWPRCGRVPPGPGGRCWISGAAAATGWAATPTRRRR